MNNTTPLKVKDISKFKDPSNQFINFLNTSEASVTIQKGSDDYVVNVRNEDQPFEIGDVVMYEYNIGIVMGLTPDGSIITDKNKIVSDAEHAGIYEVEAYRNNLIPEIEGSSYIEVTNTARRTTKCVVPINEADALGSFKNICEFYDTPIEENNTSAGGLGYDYTITLVTN